MRASKAGQGDLLALDHKLPISIARQTLPDAAKGNEWSAKHAHLQDDAMLRQLSPRHCSRTATASAAATAAAWFLATAAWLLAVASKRCLGAGTLAGWLIEHKAVEWQARAGQGHCLLLAQQQVEGQVHTACGGGGRLRRGRDGQGWRESCK